MFQCRLDFEKMHIFSEYVGVLCMKIYTGEDNGQIRSSKSLALVGLVDHKLKSLLCAMYVTYSPVRSPFPITMAHVANNRGWLLQS